MKNPQNAAIRALKYFTWAYLVTANNEDMSGITSKYVEQLTDQNVAVRRGAALALGVLPYEFLSSRWNDVLLKLCVSCAIEDNPEYRDAEARVNAVEGLVSVCETLTGAWDCSNTSSGVDDLSLYLLIKNEVVRSLLKALDDYSVDNRGDVGSWIREAAMEGLEKCTYMLCLMDYYRTVHGVESLPEMPQGHMVENTDMQTFFDTNMAMSMIGGIVKQAVEKIDKIREAAAKVLQRILYNKKIFVPFLPYRKKLEEIIPNDPYIEWSVPAVTYPRFVQLLQFSCYSRVVLSGLVVAIGGLQDSLRKVSISALMDYLEAVEVADPSERSSRECMLSVDIVWVLQEYKRCDRVIIPTLKTVEILFSKKIFLKMEAHTAVFCSRVLDSLAVELKGSKDFSKLYASIAILGYITLILEPVNTQAFFQLLILLGHRFPKIRKAAAEQVYLVLLQNENLVAEGKTERALEILSETCWDGALDAIKHQRKELYVLAGMELGETVHVKDTVPNEDGGKNPMANDENASYSSLVGSSGF
uniref:Beta-tubulin cofactor d n=1 Tax=Rhizophora mucronata TaxID=61149 RepID=A0A2P2K0Q0_RHIMU